MAKVARRLGIAFASFVIAWFAIAFLADLIFDSGNILVWVFAAVVAVGVYLALMWRDRHAG